MTTYTRPTDETNGLDIIGSDYPTRVDYSEDFTLREVAELGGTITRLRILGGGPSDGFRCDISYCHATLPGGRIVPVRVDASTGLLRDLKRDLIEWAKAERVFAKGLGLLDENNWSVLR